jgi:5-methyltetrahydropteroyltriglutamate--homocysteine methyltransferase
MKRSESRFLTTHAGSLPRTPELVELYARASRGELIDPDARAKAVEASTRRVVEKQLEVGIDIGNNGEQPRESFFTYVRERMSGFGGISQRPMIADVLRYPGFLEQKMPEYTRGPSVNLMAAPKAIGDVRYTDEAQVEQECAGFRRILDDQERPFLEPFLTAASPGIVATAMTNEHYPDLYAYVDALAAALRTEYERIVSHGFLLQIDCPDLAMEQHTYFAERPVEEFLGFANHVIQAINGALQNVPLDQVRLHLCWGNYEGPHDLDVGLETILPHLAQAHVGAFMLSMANPRHAHEYRLLRDAPLDSDALIVVGVIDTTTNYVEHPEVVADRIERAATALGDPRRVIAGTDCGFDTAAGFRDVAEDVVWAKLRVLRLGANLASERLLS